MTSQACFVVITVRPELSLDLYCDRHLTPTTQDRGIQCYSVTVLQGCSVAVTSLRVENISVLTADPAISGHSEANDHFL